VVEKELTLREVSELKEGDIIPVDMPEDFVLEAQGIPMFRGKVGVSDEHLAVKIIEQINHRRR
jgi:flagellar motor switch protein FliM